ncbi:hypothetical protein A33O_08406 [Nitratireductor aquibiodomus RA22]|uniref:EamA domain-containing protein n=1 Tax=Nitratireductor aquibiodomus RA22 TaxID=1189611 RepID=I5C0A7_9HYPH|nr:hypothetical protein A33O_08406 [Nitratireductor aquibiodomus RA22]
MSGVVHRGVVVSFSPNARGALFMSIAMAGFTVNDGLTKLVAEAMNMAQVMLVRGVMATLVMLLLAWQWKAMKKPRAVLHPMVALRVAGETGATICFLSALAHMPIANLAAVMQALPLAVTLGAAFFLNEPVGWRRWSAIIVGFIGILIIIRPGFDAFNAYSLYGVAAVAFATMRDLTTRKIPSEIPSPMISTVTAASVTIAGAVLLVPYGGWSPMSGADFAILVGATLCIVCGYHFIVLSLRAGELSFIRPLPLYRPPVGHRPWHRAFCRLARSRHDGRCFSGGVLGSLYALPRTGRQPDEACRQEHRPRHGHGRHMKISTIHSKPSDWLGSHSSARQFRPARADD